MPPQHPTTPAPSHFDPLSILRTLRQTPNAPTPTPHNNSFYPHSNHTTNHSYHNNHSGWYDDGISLSIDHSGMPQTPMRREGAVTPPIPPSAKPVAHTNTQSAAHAMRRESAVHGMSAAQSAVQNGIGQNGIGQNASAQNAAVAVATKKLATLTLLLKNERKSHAESLSKVKAEVAVRDASIAELRMKLATTLKKNRLLAAKVPQEHSNGEEKGGANVWDPTKKRFSTVIEGPWNIMAHNNVGESRGVVVNYNGAGAFSARERGREYHVERRGGGERKKPGVPRFKKKEGGDEGGVTRAEFVRDVEVDLSESGVAVYSIDIDDL